MEKKKLTDVPLHQIQIKDAFWDKYIRLVKISYFLTSGTH